MTRYERVANTTAHTGEGPLWHPEEELVYWVDIPAGKLYQYDPTTDTYELAYETESAPLGGYTIEEDGALLLFTHGTVSRWEPGADAAKPVTELKDVETRFNDVVADPEGRVFCGTMPGENASGDLYRLNTDCTVTQVVADVDIPNGMGFTENLETFYFTESLAHAIYAFDYDRETGAISKQRTVVETPSGDGIPDGMTVDEDGNIWSARWDGGRVLQYDCEGAVIEEIELPARKVSSVTFGGPEYEDLYLTTALEDSTRFEEGEGAGALFRIPDIGYSGVPKFRSRVAID